MNERNLNADLLKFSMECYFLKDSDNKLVNDFFDGICTSNETENNVEYGGENKLDEIKIKNLSKKKILNKENFTASKGFAGKENNNAFDEIYRRIRDDNKQLTDFDDDDFINDIMKSLKVEQKIKKQNKSLREQRRRKKRNYVNQYGKIIVELLYPKSDLIDVNDIGKKYGVSYVTVYKTIKYLKNKFNINFKLKSNNQPSIEKSSKLLTHPTYILIEGIKNEIESQLEIKISYQSLARDILARPENFIAKKYNLIRCGEQGRLIDDVYSDIKSRTINFFTQKGLAAPDQLQEDFKIYEEYLAKTPVRYIPPLKLTTKLRENITYQFFTAIKTEIEKHLGRGITNREYCENYLGRHPQFLEDKFGKIRRKEYLGTLMKDLLTDIKANVFTIFTYNKIPISDDLTKIFEDYEDHLILARYVRSDEMSKKFHPHLKSDFFEKINTKEKAYWLGFMMADGFITFRLMRNNIKTIGMVLSIKDESSIDLLIKTLGLNISFKNYYETKRLDKNKVQKIFRYCRINWNHQKMADDLIHHGVVPNKSKIIRLTQLDNRKLYLAFLLGYFDGDGQQGTTTIYSGNKKFLVDIKIKFKIKNGIREDHRKEYIHPVTKKIIKKDTYVYRLSLGSDLFNQMLNNYTESMERKRFFFVKPQKYKEDYITREKLQTLILDMPLKYIAKQLNITTDYIKKWSDEWDISRPNPSYWPRRTAGRKKIK